MEDAMVHVQTVTGTPYTVEYSTVPYMTVCNFVSRIFHSNHDSDFFVSLVMSCYRDT